MLHCKAVLRYVRLCAIFVFAFNSYAVFGQLTANFTIDKAGGCSPLTVAFSNTTTGASAAATYQWDLGNGNSSTLKNPGGTYRDEKTYTVTLTVKDGAQTSVKSQQVTVYKTPTVNFSPSITKGCVPLLVNFTATATPGDGTIESYFWDFGDGQTLSTTAAQQNHTYNFAQNSSVSLTVKNNYGCYKTLQKDGLVQSLPAIKVAFTADKTVLCKTGEAVKFSNTSTGPPDITWLWDFGDGKTSTEKEPLHIYDKKGTYSVKLSVNSASGCSLADTRQSYINVANFLTDFSSPSLVCQAATVEFKGNSSPSPNASTWYVDDQLIYYNNTSLQYNFYSEGTHKVKLVNTFGTCQDEVTKSFVVKPAPKLEGFVVDTRGVCGAPVNIQLKDTSAAAVKWEWSYWPYYNIISSVKEPLLSIERDVLLEVGLKITDAAGCSAFTSKYVTIVKPNIYIQATSPDATYSWGSGCEGMTMKFACSEAESISEYKWDFGDGGTSTEAQPSHTYSKAGTYRVKVDWVTKSGCKGEALYSTYVEVSKKPVADFTVANGTTICGNTPTTFNAVYGTNNPATGFLWKVDDLIFSYSGGSSFTHKFTKDTTYTITLIANNGSCRDTLVKTNYVTVLPPFPKVGQLTNTCDGTRGLLTIADETTKARKWQWDFGDGTAPVTYTAATPTVEHLYTKTGKYKVVLAATNGACTVKDSTTAYVYLKQKPVATSSQTEICASNNLNLTVTNMEDISFLDYYYYYHISFSAAEYGDGTRFNGYASGTSFSAPPVTMQLQNLEPGKTDLRLVFKTGYFGCYDTTNYVPIKIKGPTVGYEIKNNNSCFKTPIIFQDTSKGTNNIAITKWEWSFGNGSTKVATNNNPVSIRYNTPGSYYVQLKVTDADGCSATNNGYYNQYATVTGPGADFNYSPVTVQPGATVDFYNNTNNYNAYYTNYTWMFSDGTTTTDFNTSRFYPNIGTDTVKLIAKNPESTCVDTAIKVITIKNVNAAFTYTSSYINNNSCPPVIVKFTNKSANFTHVSWDFGDGSRTDNQNFPSHTYYKPGVYVVTLYATSTTGITDSITDSVTVKGPYAVLKSDKLFACGSQQIVLSAEVKNASSYTWDFADGELKETRDTFAVHTYAQPGIYTPSLILRDGGGCSATSDLPDKIVIDTLNVSISKSPQHVCDSAYVQFNPVVTSLAADGMQQALQYKWNFGTNRAADTANIQTPVFNFNKPGRYGVSLTVASPYGCEERVTDTVVVIQKAKAAISGPNEVCQGANALFTGSADVGGIANWSWQFGNNNVSTVQNPMVQQYTQAGLMQVQLTISKDGCFDTASKTITVRARPVINLTPKNPTVCLGNSVQLGC